LPRLVAPLVVDYSTSHRLVVGYFASAARPVSSARRVARRRLLGLCRVFGCLGSSRRSSSTTPPRAGSSSTTSPPPRVRVPRHIARLVTRLAVPLVVDYSTSPRFVVDYFASAARPGASARRSACHQLLHLAQAHRRLLRLHCTSGCLGSSLGSSRGSSRRSSSITLPRVDSSSTTSPPPCVRVPQHVAWLVTRLVVIYSASRRLVVDYFAYAARPGASARRTARHADRRVARRRLLRLRCTSGCLGTSRGSSLVVDYSASRRLVARLVAPLVVDYFAYAACPGASARRAARHAAHRRLLRALRLRLAATVALLQPRRVS
jgi:hypothetical protein